MQLLSVHITTLDREEAERIGRDLVESRLAACINILGGARSIYWWEGAVQSETEAVLLAKTRDSLLDGLIARVKSMHSDACPCVVAWPIVGGNPDYLDSLSAETEPIPPAMEGN